MSTNARGLLGLPDDTNEEYEEPNQIRKFFSKFNSPFLGPAIAGVVWPISLFAFKSNKIYLAVLGLMLIISCFVNGWEIYAFTGFLVGLFLSISINSSENFSDVPKGARFTANLIFLSLVFYFSFPLDYWAAESEIKSKSPFAVSVDVAPPDEEDFIIVEIDKQKYKNVDDVYAGPDTYAAFLKDFKPLAQKSADWSKTGLGLPFMKENPTKLRFIFADKSDTEIALKVFYQKPTFDFTQNFQVSSSNKKSVSFGCTATGRWKDGFRGELAIGSIINVIYSPSESGPWTQVGTATYGEHGAFGEFVNPGPGFLKIQVPASAHLKVFESEAEPVPKN